MSDTNIKKWPGDKPAESDSVSAKVEDILEGPSDDLDNTETHDAESGQRHKRGIYLLPNLLTTGTLFGGFYAILAGLGGNFEAAAIAIFAAMFFDGLDGRVARMTNTQSEFGVEYDSLSDMVAFGVAPAVLVYMWILEPLGKFGWSVSFIFLSCAALRLARFNVRTTKQDRRYFVGLASPAAAAVVASIVWTGSELSPSWGNALLPALLTGAAGLLMVSNIRYHSFKEINFAHKVPFAVVLGICLIIAVVMVNPPRVLLLLALCYALYAPILVLFRYAKKFSPRAWVQKLKRNDSTAPK